MSSPLQRASGRKVPSAFIAPDGGEMTRRLDGGRRHVIRFQV
jgi:hypothetical protein